ASDTQAAGERKRGILNILRQGTNQQLEVSARINRNENAAGEIRDACRIGTFFLTSKGGREANAESARGGEGLRECLTATQGVTRGCRSRSQADAVDQRFQNRKRDAVGGLHSEEPKRAISKGDCSDHEAAGSAYRTRADDATFFGTSGQRAELHLLFTD